MLAGLSLARRMERLNWDRVWREVSADDKFGRLAPAQNYLGRDERARGFYLNEAARSEAGKQPEEGNHGD
jgi:hypothetical protein